jgi:hypothetical protein
MDRKKQQVPPLRYAPVGMTNSFKTRDFSRITNKVTASRDDKVAGGGFYGKTLLGWENRRSLHFATPRFHGKPGQAG